MVTTSDLIQAQNGIFTLVMGKLGNLRGMMQLGLKTHVHDYSVFVKHVVEPTCTTDGTDLYQCAYCDKTQEKTVPKLGHDTVRHEGQAATCTEAGWKAYDTCSRCNYTTYEAIPKLGHAIVNHEAKAATCTEDGWKAYDTCSRCNYTTYEAIPRLGHAIVHHEAKAATCTEDGWKAYDTCQRCDYTTFKAIPSLGHDHKAVVTPPTCTEKGFTTYTCARGDDTYTGDETDPTGHKWGETTYTWSADNKTVTARRVCQNDPSHVEEETADVTGEVTKQPTTGAKGETTYTATFKNPAFAAQSKTLADIDKLPPQPNPIVPTPVVLDTPKPQPEPEPEPEVQTAKNKVESRKLVYSRVDALRGLNAADRTEMGAALKTIAQSIEAEAKTKGGLRGRRDANQTGGKGAQGLGVRMWYLDEGVLVPADLLARYDALSLQDRLFILMDLLGCGTPEDLTEEGQAVLKDIHAAVDAMTPEQQVARQADMDKHFLPRTVVDENNVQHKSVGIELEIAEGNHLSYERYTFFEDEGEWKLFELEKGEYR